MKDERVEKTARSVVLCVLLSMTALTISSCSDEANLMTAPVLDEIITADTETLAAPPITLLSAEMKQPEEAVTARTGEMAEAPERQDSAQDTTPPTAIAHLALYTNTNSGKVTLEPPPLSISAQLAKSGELGSDVRQGETVTLVITANRDMTGEMVQFFVDGRPEGIARLTREQENTYHASFVANNCISAGPVTVRFADGRDIEVAEHLYYVKTHPPPPARVGAPAIYSQWVDADGFPIVATDAVNPRALDEAAWTMKQMIGHRHGWLRQLGDAGKFFVVLEYTKSITHFYNSIGVAFPKDVNAGEWARGIVTANKITVAGEETLLGYQAKHVPGAYMDDYNSTTIHELTHTIHRVLLEKTEFNDRLINAYKHAKKQGLWGTSYVVKNEYEYFAMGSELWFGESIPWLRKYVAPSRESLREYDRNLADLLEEVFGDRPWRRTPTRERLHLPHLQGYDPTIAPIMDFDAL